MSKINVKVDWKSLILYDKEGNEHQIFEHEFWYLAPTKITWNEKERSINPLDFAMVLHNAKNGHGIVVGMDQLLEGIEPKSLKSGSAKVAENLLEEIRKDKYPEKPSRLRCHYLNYDKKIAEKRAISWNWKNRKIVRCYLILSSGRYHYADVSVFEKLVLDQNNISLAEKYWETFLPIATEDFYNLEILADCCLYFPDWQTFPSIDIDLLMKYNNLSK